MTSIIENPKDRGILIVDDDQPIIEILRKLLAQEEYTHVFAATNGAEALSLLSSRPESVYLILLDMNLPEMSGIEVVKHLANVHPFHVGVVIITGYGSLDRCVSFYKAGSEKVMPLDFIEKPLNFEQIKSEVATALETVHRKRKGHIVIAGSEVHERFDRLDSRLETIQAKTASIADMHEIKKDLATVIEKLPTFVEQIGMDVLRAILIALAFVALLYLGMGKFLAQLIDKGP